MSVRTPGTLQVPLNGGRHESLSHPKKSRTWPRNSASLWSMPCFLKWEDSYSYVHMHIHIHT